MSAALFATSIKGWPWQVSALGSSELEQLVEQQWFGYPIHMQACMCVEEACSC